jgi:hypothetical protein
MIGADDSLSRWWVSSSMFFSYHEKTDGQRLIVFSSDLTSGCVESFAANGLLLSAFWQVAGVAYPQPAIGNYRKD